MRRGRTAITIAGAALASMLGTAAMSQVGGFGDGPKPDNNPPGPRVSTTQEKTFPLGWSWVAVSVNGKPVGNDRPTMLLDENLRGTGFSGCNNFSATMYPLKEQGFAVGPVAVTRKACDKAVMDAERGFLIVLRTSNKWDLVGGRLTLRGSSGELVFERAI